MGKILLTISLLLCTITSFSQRTGEQYIYSYGANTIYNYVLVPESYDANPAKRYPLVIMFNGTGEVQNNWSTINKYGPTAEIVNGRWNGVQQFGDSTFEFIAVSFQFQNEAIPSQSVVNNNTNNLKSRYRVDTCRIYAVGLSLGWQAFVRVVGNTTDYTESYSQYTAAFMMSGGTSYPTASVDSMARWARKGGSLMYTIGSADDKMQVATIKNIMMGINGRPGSCYGQTWTSPPWSTAGHGGWDYGFDSSYSDPDLGLNAWRWLLGHSKRPYANVGQTSITTTSTSVTLNGIVNEFPWGYNGQYRTITWSKISGPSATISTPNSDTTDVDLTGGEGTYVFRLTSANAAGGLSATKDVTVIKQSSSLPPGVASIKEKWKRWFIKKAE